MNTGNVVLGDGNTLIRSAFNFIGQPNTAANTLINPITLNDTAPAVAITAPGTLVAAGPGFATIDTLGANISTNPGGLVPGVATGTTNVVGLPNLTVITGGNTANGIVITDPNANNNVVVDTTASIVTGTGNLVTGQNGVFVLGNNLRVQG